MLYSNSNGVDFSTTTAALPEHLKLFLPFFLIFWKCLFFKKFISENLAGENTFDAFSNVCIFTEMFALSLFRFMP